MRALEQKGWSVWWDRDIPPGKTFDQVVEEAINAAKCVIVVWSKDSVRSDWVKTEAAEGARRGILIPVLIDDVKLPLEFRRIQAASLVDWTGTLSHPGFEQLSEAIAGILSHSPSGVTPGIQEQGTGGKKGEETKRLDQELRERETHEKADRAGQEEPPAFYQQKVEVTPNKGVPAPGRPKNWPKIIAGAGIVVLIIAAVIVYREFTREVKITVQSPKIEYFKAIPETVEKGEKSNLSWSTSNAKEVFLVKKVLRSLAHKTLPPKKPLPIH